MLPPLTQGSEDYRRKRAKVYGKYTVLEGSVDIFIDATGFVFALMDFDGGATKF